MSENVMEKPVQIIVNGRAVMTIMTSSEDPKDLVVGQLFTERVIESFSDIESMQSNGPEMSVVTKNPFGILLSRKTVLAGCGGASSFLDSGKLERISSMVDVSYQQILESSKKIPKTGWYSAGLFFENGDEIFLSCDLTGQNVLDELIGRGLSQNISFERCYAVIFGNVTVEMIRKAVIAKVPVLGVMGEVTAAALKSAEELGIRVVMIKK